VKSLGRCAAGRGLGAGCCRSSAVEEMEGACHLEAETGGFAVPGSEVAREPWTRTNAARAHGGMASRG
jgi:hypothetical protein